jgi:hypothetical protein
MGNVAEEQVERKHVNAYILVQEAHDRALLVNRDHTWWIETCKRGTPCVTCDDRPLDCELDEIGALLLVCCLKRL